jgi:hypothetical protein
MKNEQSGTLLWLPNKSLQRTVNHKVLGRDQVVSAPLRAPRARVLTGQPAAAELSR